MDEHRVAAAEAVEKLTSKHPKWKVRVTPQVQRQVHEKDYAQIKNMPHIFKTRVLRIWRNMCKMPMRAKDMQKITSVHHACNTLW